MPTFGEWERVVLTRAYDFVDYISCHAYYENRGDLGSFLASGVDMDRFIASVVTTADQVKSVLGASKTINISFDEWNVWYSSRFENTDKIQGAANWPRAPRLLEDVYTVTDAVVFGSLLITLLRHADRVTSASLAQLVNVIAPIMTEPGGTAWRQTTFFPFAATSAHARGVAVDVGLRSETYHTEQFGSVAVVDAVASYDEGAQRYAVYAVNRSATEPTELLVDVSHIDQALDDLSVSARVLSDQDPEAANTLDEPDRVQLAPLAIHRDEPGSLKVVLPPISWAEILLELR